MNYRDVAFMVRLAVQASVIFTTSSLGGAIRAGGTGPPAEGPSEPGTGHVDQGLVVLECSAPSDPLPRPLS